MVNLTALDTLLLNASSGSAELRAATVLSLESTAGTVQLQSGSLNVTGVSLLVEASAGPLQLISAGVLQLEGRNVSLGSSVTPSVLLNASGTLQLTAEREFRSLGALLVLQSDSLLNLSSTSTLHLSSAQALTADSSGTVS